MLSKWIYCVICASVVCAVCSAIAGEGKIKKSLEFVCAVVIVAALLTPIAGFDFDGYSMTLAKYEAEAKEIADEATEKSDLLNRKYIEEEYAAYILDKAVLKGISPKEVNVTVKWSTDGYWYPTDAEIVLSEADMAKDNSGLKNIIEAELGIPIERQVWREE